MLQFSNSFQGLLVSQQRLSLEAAQCIPNRNTSVDCTLSFTSSRVLLHHLSSASVLRFLCLCTVSILGFPLWASRRKRWSFCIRQFPTTQQHKKLLHTKLKAKMTICKAATVKGEFPETNQLLFNTHYGGKWCKSQHTTCFSSPLLSQNSRDN